ncbi:PHP domain-containing protein [Anaerolineales bacterium HSG24]|nr:PHP domain-containing protein [Anaerolineales bacterium HSG24]
MSHYQIDLHSHTTASDGILTPTKLVEHAAQQGLTVLGIADHDTVAGVNEAVAAGQQHGLEVMPAIEFSTRHEPDKMFIGLHLLGYFIDPNSATLLEMIEKVRQGRVNQKIRQIEKLQSFGFNIMVDEVFARVKGVPGRPHIAATLLEKYPDRFASIQHIFEEYLGSQAKAHVKRSFVLSVGEVIELVKQVGGLPVLAHPGVYANDGFDPLTIVRNAHKEGVEGVEVWYPYAQSHHAPSMTSNWVSQIDQLADELNLLKTGGTDFHGRPHETVALGEQGLTEAQFDNLKQGWRKNRT